MPDDRVPDQTAEQSPVDPSDAGPVGRAAGRPTDPIAGRAVDPERRRAIDEERARGVYHPAAKEGDPTPFTPTRMNVEDLFAFLGKPHMLSIMFAIGPVFKEKARFIDIQKHLQISPNTISNRLKELVQAGLLTRTAYNEIPPRVEYEPTDKLHALVPAFIELHKWCMKHTLEADD